MQNIQKLNKMLLVTRFYFHKHKFKVSICSTKNLGSRFSHFSHFPKTADWTVGAAFLGLDPTLT